jgi:hypothetical protein
VEVAAAEAEDQHQLKAHQHLVKVAADVKKLYALNNPYLEVFKKINGK